MSNEITPFEQIYRMNLASNGLRSSLDFAKQPNDDTTALACLAVRHHDGALSPRRSLRRSAGWRSRKTVAKAEAGIDPQVYALYGLTPEEIKIVEDSLR